MNMERAYTVLDIKAVDESKRTISGIASTPTADRMGDVVEPLGAVFETPMPLLHQHHPEKVVGWVEFAKPNKNGIPYTARFDTPEEDDPQPLKDRINTAWKEAKRRLVRGVSIGFRPLEHAFMDSGGIRFSKWEWLELSLVTIPANAEANIQTIKSIDSAVRAASGISDEGVINRPGVTGTQKKAVAKTVSIHSQTRDTKMNLQDQIKQYETLRAKKVEAMDAIMAKSAETGETLNAEQEEAYDTAAAELEAIDKHLARLKAHEKSVAAKAVPVVDVTTVEKGTQARGTTAPTIIVKGDKDEAFKGQNYTRIVIAKTLARLEGISAIGIAKHRWGQSNPLLVDVVRAAVEGGGTGTGEWGAELAEADTRYTGDFIEYLYGQTVYDQLPLRVVPANIVIKGQDGAATAYWVGESKSIPVTKVDFMDVELKYKKVAALAVVSKELLRESSPSAEMLVRDALVQASSQRVDQTFLGTGGASDSTPAGILNGVVGISSAGSDGDGVREDLKALRAAFINAKNSGGQQLVMHPGLADAIGLLTNALGQAEFPDITAEGGSLRRTPVKTGDNVNPNHLIMLKPSDIWKIGDRGVEVSLSTEASIEMDNAPTGASDTPVANTSLVSMFQTESVALKVVRPLNFAKRRTSAVAYISDADYGQATSSP